MKPRWTLLPWDALADVAELVTEGTATHPERGWERQSTEEMADALLRHLSAWLQGEGTDPESGRSHLVHMAARALMLAALERRS